MKKGTVRSGGGHVRAVGSLGCRAQGLRLWGWKALRTSGRSACREAVSRSILDRALRLRPEGFWEGCKTT